MTTSHIKQFKSGQSQLSAKHLNKIVGEANKTIVGQSGIKVFETPDNVFLSLEQADTWWVGQVESDEGYIFSDCRYSVIRQKCDMTTEDQSDIVTFADETIVARSDWVTVTNLAEATNNSHLLSEGQYVKVYTLTDDGFTVPRRYVMDESPFELDVENYIQFYQTYEGKETAESDNWIRSDTILSDTGVVMPITTRIVYNHTGDEILYGFYRKLTFDSAGNLEFASDEVRYEIDTPSDCTATLNGGSW